MNLQPDSPLPIQAIIVGAGFSSLTLAYHLLKRGVRPLILEAASELASSWRGRHPQLSLNTHRLLSGLPGMLIAKDKGTFVSRDDYIDYLERYAHRLQTQYNLEILFDQKISEILHLRNGWKVSSQHGHFYSSHVAIATGPDRVPFQPEWPGEYEFNGSIVHAGKFGKIDQYDNKHVLIVGGANSGIDIANHLIRRNRHRSLNISMRHGAHLMPTRLPHGARQHTA